MLAGRLERGGRLRHLDGDRGQGRGRQGRQARRRPREGVDRGPRRAAASTPRPRSRPRACRRSRHGRRSKNASGTDAIRQAKVGRYNAANARREAQQQVDDLRTQIRFATLTAPIDGTITAVNIAKGLDSTGTAISIASSGYEVTADVVESDVSSMSVGQDATVTRRRDRGDDPGHGLGDRPDGRRQQRVGQRGLVSRHGHAHGRAVGPAGGHDRGHHDRHRVGDQRADDPRRGPPRHGRQLPGPGHGRRRHADDQGGRGRARHEHDRRDQVRPHRGRDRHHRHGRGPHGDQRQRQQRFRTAAASAAAASPSTAAAPSSRGREHRTGDGAVRRRHQRRRDRADHQPARHQPHLRHGPRDRPRAARRRPRRPPGRVPGHRRAVGVGQEHDDEHRRLPRPARRRAPTASPARPSRSSTTTAWRASAAGRSGSSSSRTTSCRGRPRWRTSRRRCSTRASAAPSGPGGRPRRSSGSAWATASTTSPRSCPAASSSGSPSPGRWSPTPP